MSVGAGARVIDPAVRPRLQDQDAVSSWAPVGALLLVHVAAWTAYGALALGGALHDDMVEAWYWAQEPQLGYFKHPPLFAWMTWGWFHVFPVADWSFYLFAAVNAAAGLAGAAVLAAQLGFPEHRRSVVAFLMLTPLYGFMALKYNANAVLIPVWPWATVAFVRALRSGKAIDGALFGAMAAIAMLGKYYSLLLLVSFFAAALLPPHRRTFFRSPAPYVAVLVGSLLIAPHVAWSVANDWPPVAYALSKFAYPMSRILFWALMTALAPLIFLTIPVVLAARFAGIRLVELPRALWRELIAPHNARLAILAVLPFLLTLAFGLFGHAKVSLAYTIPIFFLSPLVLLLVLGRHRPERVARGLTTAAVVCAIGVVAAAPVVGWARFTAEIENATVPVPELADGATRFWRQLTGRRLAIVAGTERVGGSPSFYSPDHPVDFTGMRRSQAPWVTRERLDREGILVICNSSDAVCAKKARALMATPPVERSLTISRSSHGRSGPPTTYLLLAHPPRPGAPRLTGGAGAPPALD